MEFSLIRYCALFSLLAPAYLAAQYKETAVLNPGSLAGTVRFKNAETRQEQMLINKDEAICGRAKNSPSVVLGKGGGVKDAVIEIIGVREGKKWAMNMRPVLDQQGCEYVPHVLLAPVGAQLEIVNSDPILHNVHAYDLTRGGHTVFNIAQPIKGQKTAIEQTRLKTPGVLFATCDAGHPWMAAYVVVADHPYYVLTDAKGNFRIDGIPEGEYTVRMWHEGIRIVDREFDRSGVKKYVFEKPYELRQSVVIRKGTVASLDFELALRGEQDRPARVKPNVNPR